MHRKLKIWSSFVSLLKIFSPTWLLALICSGKMHFDYWSITQVSSLLLSFFSLLFIRAVDTRSKSCWWSHCILSHVQSSFSASLISSQSDSGDQIAPISFSADVIIIIIVLHATVNLNSLLSALLIRVQGSTFCQICDQILTFLNKKNFSFYIFFRAYS